MDPGPFRISALRIAGFKSFPEPVRLPILPGLTGIVGPNGCGKSNLVEALRFVMGEGSSRALRGEPGGALDALIFGGTSRRPPRDVAEVSLVVETDAGVERAIVRRLVRGEGSRWTLDGRDVRAHDIRVLLADHGLGPGGASLVGQGRVAELIAQRPEDRRALIEEAAQVSGLALRRREIGARLAQLAGNVARARDRTAELEARAARLERQARQAQRYREAADALRAWQALARRLELALAEEALAQVLAAGRRARDARDQARQQLEAHRIRLVEAGARQEAARQAALEAARAADQAEAEAHRLELAETAHRERLADAREALARAEGEASRARSRAHDAERQCQALDNEAARLARDEKALAEQAGTIDEASAEVAANEAARRLAEVLAAHAEATATERASRARRAAVESSRHQLEGELQELAQRQERLEAERRAAERDSRQAAEAAAAAHAPLGAQREALARALEDEAAAAAGWEAAASAVADAQARLSALEAEARALAERRAAAQGSEALIEPPAGLEAAVAAALGRGIAAPLAPPGAPADQPGWHGLPLAEPPAPLPEGTIPLSGLVEAPEALQRSLAAVGLIDAPPRPADWARLKPGQRLVSRDGAVWTWDGQHLPPGEAAGLGLWLESERRAKAVARALPEAAEAVAAARAGRARVEEARRRAAAAAASARRAVAAGEQEARRATDRAAALARTLADLEARAARLAQEARAHRERLAQLAGEAAPRPQPAGASAALLPALAEARAADDRARRQLAEVRAASHARLGRRRELDARRRALVAERASWGQRQQAAAAEAAELEAHLAKLAPRVRELDTMVLAEPEQRRALMREAARRRSAAAQEAEQLALATAQLEALGREEPALVRRLEAAIDEAARAEADRAAREREVDAARRAVPPDVEPAAAAPGSLADQLAAAQAEVRRLADARDRLGAVNLAAEAELADVAGQLAIERRALDDVEEAARGIEASFARLETEARRRLETAFALLNTRFGELFGRLFGGGRAELAWTGGGDRLSDGLAILAQPPGKRLQSLALLSGGEQAMTALALILARVSLSGVAIAVLDEVDAPLDDANAERLVDLVRALSSETATRFLVVTHNPLTMERMDRLVGVTMGEPGVSRLVGLDLAEARRVAATEESAAGFA